MIARLKDRSLVTVGFTAPSLGRRFAVLVALSALPALSCSSAAGEDACRPTACPVTTLSARLVSGNITFAIGSRAPETRALSRGEPWQGPPPRSDQCLALGPVTFVGPEGRGSGEIEVICELTEGSLVMTLGGFDFRPANGGGALASGLVLYTSFATPACISGGGTGTTTVALTRIEGNAAPYPTAVTADYVREYTLHMESGQVEFGAACTTVSATADVQLIESASDVVNHPDAFCGCV